MLSGKAGGFSCKNGMNFPFKLKCPCHFSHGTKGAGCFKGDKVLTNPTSEELNVNEEFLEGSASQTTTHKKTKPNHANDIFLPGLCKAYKLSIKSSEYLHLL